VALISDDTDLVLRAALDFGPDHTYTIKNGGLGPTLLINAYTKEQASVARALIPGTWEGLYTIVVYTTENELK